MQHQREREGGERGERERGERRDILPPTIYTLCLWLLHSPSGTLFD
jgi:hypothetical protein